MINTPQDEEFPNFGSTVSVSSIITLLANTYKPDRPRLSPQRKVQLSSTPPRQLISPVHLKNCSRSLERSSRNLLASV